MSRSKSPVAFLLVCWMSLSGPLFAQHEPNLPWVDISGQTSRQVVIAAGTPDLYNGHPTTVLFDDGRTLFCTWSRGHALSAGWQNDGRLPGYGAAQPHEGSFCSLGRDLF